MYTLEMSRNSVGSAGEAILIVFLTQAINQNTRKKVPGVAPWCAAGVFIQVAYEKLERVTNRSTASRCEGNLFHLPNNYREDYSRAKCACSLAKPGVVVVLSLCRSPTGKAIATSFAGPDDYCVHYGFTFWLKGSFGCGIYRCQRISTGYG